MMFTLKNSLFVLTLLSMFGCALMAGVFFAFSTFVMRGLGRITANQGIAAMQSINQVVPSSLFGVAFLITPLLCLAAIILAGFQWNETNVVYTLAGGIIYLAANFLVTLIFNIPLNNSLAAIGPTAAGSEAVWNNYQSAWNFWNHIRTVGSAVSAILFSAALLR